MKFTKAQTNGNDFVIIESVSEHLSAAQKRLIADRQFGVGCDQLIFVTHLTDDNYSVSFFNQDGSAATMCGNGSCAVSLYLNRKYGVSNINLNICNRIYRSKVFGNHVTVSFPVPYRDGEVVVTGNRHLVLPVDDVSRLDELSTMHPDCNLHFIEFLSDRSIRVKTFERGVGWTLACGSGAIAVGFSTGLNGDIHIIHDGGESIVNVLSDSVELTTSPKLVFSGDFYAEG